MPHIRIHIHLVWATKNREPLLSRDLRRELFQHIQKNAKDKNIMLKCINGYTDHVPCLVALPANQTIAKITQLLKGESSYWINKSKLHRSTFEWQDEYLAASVSYSHLDIVRE